MNNLKSISFERISWAEFLERRRMAEYKRLQSIGAPWHVAFEAMDDAFNGNEEPTAVGFQPVSQ